MPPDLHTIHIWLAEDDNDDIMLFVEAIEELSLSVELTSIRNGEQLMEKLRETNLKLPDILFLDVNMPRKNGFECLREIKQDARLQKIPVTIMSTASESEDISKLYKNGAHYYIRKPNNFEDLRNLIHQVLMFVKQPDVQQPSREHFVIHTNPPNGN